MRDMVGVTRQSHKLRQVGSSPTPATTLEYKENRMAHEHLMVHRHLMIVGGTLIVACSCGKWNYSGIPPEAVKAITLLHKTHAKTKSSTKTGSRKKTQSSALPA